MKKIIALFVLFFNLNVYGQQGMNFFYSAQGKHDSNDYEGAIAGYSKAIEFERHPMNLAIFFKSRGDAKLKQLDYYGAIADYTKSRSAYEHHDLYDSLLLSRAEAKTKVKDYRGAIDDCTKYINNNNYIIAKLARESSTSIKYNGGKYTPEQNVRFERRYSSVYLSRGYAKLNIDDYSGAIVDFDKAIKIEPSYALAFYNRGLAKINLRQIQSACLDFSKAGELGEQEAYKLIRQYCQ